MSSIDELNDRIQALKERRDELYDKIRELEDAYDYIAQRKANIENNVYKPACTYDMTRNGEWLGERERDGEDYRNEIDTRTSEGLNETAQLLEDILQLIENIKEEIRRIEEEIDSLRAERDSLIEASQPAQGE